jgi:hypothetical protein
MQIRNPRWKKFGSGIRDKHPGSATLIKCMILGVIGDRFVEKEVRFEHVQTIFRRIRCFLY